MSESNPGENPTKNTNRIDFKGNPERLEELKQIFVGKSVNITHSGNSSLKNESGVCKNFHIYGTGPGIYIELEKGVRVGLIPDTITNTYIEGDVADLTAGRRKIELAEMV